MTLTTVAPTSMHEDELKIGKAYRQAQWRVLMFTGSVAVTAYFSDLKWTIVAAVAVLAANLDGLESRLYDLVIRTQRTNKLLRLSASADE